MGFTKSTTDIANISRLPNVVNNQAAFLKAEFDKGPLQVQTDHNALIDELEAQTASANLGAIDPTASEEEKKATVQTVLNNLHERNNNLDKAKEGIIKDATEKEEIVDGDLTPIIDSEDKNITKKTTFANVKLFFKEYFDTLYNNYVLPKATIDSLGGIIPDGETTMVDENGVLKAVATESADYTARNTLTNHKDTKVNSEAGVHGIRFFNNILSYKDDEEIWQKIGDDTIDSRVSLLEKTIYNNIEGNAFLIVFDSLTGINLSAGSYNATTKVIEC